MRVRKGTYHQLCWPYLGGSNRSSACLQSLYLCQAGQCTSNKLCRSWVGSLIWPSWLGFGQTCGRLIAWVIQASSASSLPSSFDPAGLLQRRAWQMCNCWWRLCHCGLHGSRCGRSDRGWGEGSFGTGRLCCKCELARGSMITFGGYGWFGLIIHTFVVL